MNTRSLVVWCADWPVTATGHDGDEVPVATVHANRVQACSAAARAGGVRRGLRRREAESRCPGLVVMGADPARDARAFEPVVAVVETIAPRVEVLRPGVCVLATLGPSRYFGGDHALAARVTGLVVGLTGEPAGEPASGLARVRCSVGVADSVFAALLAARTGVGVVAPGATARFLAPLTIASLERPALVDLLDRLGITTLGRLAALERADVTARFGPEGEVAHRLASGLDERALAPRALPPDLVVTAEFDPPASRVDVVTFAAKGLADELHRRLTGIGMACDRVVIEAETEHGERLARVWRSDGPFSPQAMADRMRWQVDGWLSGSAAGRPSAGITLVRLVPDEVVPDNGCQLGFLGGSAAVDERAARGLARLQGLLGPEAVTVAAVVGGRGPREAVARVPWGDERVASPDGMAVAGRPWPGSVPSPAPATVWADPLPIEVTDEAGTPVTVTARLGLSSAPARVDGVEVLSWAGPWPLDQRWWDSAAHQRQARFQVVVASGVAHLLVLEGGRWRLEATYD